MIDLSLSIYDLEYFLLIMTRVSCFVFIAPFFSTNNTPARVRVCLSFFVALLLYQVLSPTEAVIYDTVMEYAIIVIKEAVVGLLIGLGATICTSIVSFAGKIADMETGLAMATMWDPATKENLSITGAFYQYTLMLMLIASGMYRYLLGALADTFVLIPVNGAVFRSDALVETVIRFMSDYIIIGFRIVLPIFCVMILLNSILGVLAKVSPQMNMFSVGIQLKILTGLSILFLSAGMLLGISEFIFDEMQMMVSGFAESLRP